MSDPYDSTSVVTQPQSVTAQAGSQWSMSVGAEGVRPLRYQWYGPDGLIGGATGSTYTTTARPWEAGSYYCVVTSASGDMATSSSATLTVTTPDVAILLDPQDATITEHAQVTLEVSAYGYGPASYQWYDASDDSAIAGETGRKITLDRAISVYCIVTDEYGSSATSQTATVTVVAVRVTDQTSQVTQTLPDPRPTITRRYDWDSLVASVEKQSIKVEDYDFSGRTFKRRDNLFNRDD